MMRAPLLALACCLAACCSVCEPTSTRCNGSAPEVCSATGQWQQVMSCDDLQRPDSGGVWVCCVVPRRDGGRLHTCLPILECAGGE
jgi:hypothetical protein